jgi:hypothetical protein
LKSLGKLFLEIISQLIDQTLFNAPASHLAACIGSTAINYTIVGDNGTFLIAMSIAAEWSEPGGKLFPLSMPFDRARRATRLSVSLDSTNTRSADESIVYTLLGRIAAIKAGSTTHVYAEPAFLLTRAKLKMLVVFVLLSNRDTVRLVDAIETTRLAGED